jgi:hypothetical protein
MMLAKMVSTDCVLLAGAGFVCERNIVGWMQ